MCTCTNCGSKINNENKFCHNCGESIIKEKKQKFIEIMDNNIKISNIKDFGVATDDKYYKAIKVPIYEKNPEYTSLEKGSMNFIKKIMLDATPKYLETKKLALVDINQFEKEYYKATQDNNYRKGPKFVLPYKIINSLDNKITKETDETTSIDVLEEYAFVYWKYLYITTYQNENHKFYGFQINIDEKLMEIEKLIK